MEQYKIINAELMDQVQRQRITIAEMLKTEVLLKRQLLEEREIRLADAQYNEQKLKCAIRTMLHSLDLNLDSREDYEDTSQTSKASENVKPSSYHNGQACSELRRSSERLQRALPVSPIRRSRSSVSSCNNSQHEASERSTTPISPCNEKVTIVRKTPEPRHLAELEANTSSPQVQESPEPAHPTPTPTTVVGYMYSIIEESDNEENTSSSSVDSSDTLQKSSIKPSETISSMEASPSPLRDMTNVQKRRPRFVPSVKSAKELSPSKEISLKTETQTSLDHSDQNISKTMIGKHESIVGKQEPSIERVRAAARSSSPMQVTLPCSSLKAEPTLTPRRSQLNFSSFNGIANRPEDCSTPRQDETTLISNWPLASTKTKGKRTRSTASGISLNRADNTSIEGSIASRARRNCRPSSLKEASLRTKLRNETQTK
ncbi:shugoshin [Drosophila mojavensis]|uniref:Shugoshin C-terminal domain-containing protein n=1 Tax=Drosophila mojavensis TaxID=7230 RepID=B4KMU9_DROMO|nr:shugoshin [Drosophila mojavensis]EDW09871.2 uncharacterized protein Dmoj_GI18821 [Drosophila mojavensis]